MKFDTCLEGKYISNIWLTNNEIKLKFTVITDLI